MTFIADYCSSRVTFSNMLIILLLCLHIAQQSHAFNVGSTKQMYIVHRGTKNTLFGYDVAMYKNGPEEYSLLVGAPRAHSGQPNVIRGGAVYSCSSRITRCAVQYFDRKGDPEALHGDVSRKIGSKSDQWFGATVVALNTDDDSQSAVVACAPHYLYFGSKFDIKEPIGSCFYANRSFQNIQQFSPCKVKHRLGYHRLGYCMAGFSAAVGKDNQIFLGEPGAYYWGGAVSTKSTNFAKPATHTQNGSKEYDDQFMGYSSAVGDFNGDNIDDVAVGVPRGNFLTGKVVLYNDRLENLLNLTGDQMGSYFGASIAVTDLNGDKLHDIIVGAPLFTKIETGSAGVQSTYEIGRVYVYFQSPTHTFDKFVTIDGHKEWGRFGYDVAAAGDLNQDGYNDFVVGAPLDGLDRKSGAVYIYNGAKNGIRGKYSQVIYGQSIQNGIETFGFSVSGGRDVDNNGYPDLFIGAYKSDVAVLFKSRPVVSIEGDINLSPPVINLNNKDCRIVQSGRSEMVSCVKMETCATYHGKGLSPDIDMRFVISLDVNNKKDVPRAKFLTRGTMSSMVVETAMYENERFCTNSEIYVEEGIRDKLSPIMIHVNYSVIEDRFKRSVLVPIVDNLDGGFFKKELKIWRDCGRDDQCTPDLQITTADISRGRLAAGADDRFNVSVTVRNRLEPAYEAYLYVYTPKGMDLEKSLELKNRKITCDRQTSAADEIASYDVVRCDLGNPMAGNRLIYDLVLTFATKFFEGPFDRVPIYVKVNSTNNETKDTLYDNMKNLTMSFSLDADIEVFAGNTSAVYETDGYRDPANFHWDTDIGPAVNHTYELVNSKNSTLNEIQLDIYFPSHTHDGEPLLYIIKDIILEDNHETSECHLLQKANINPNHYAIEGDYRRHLVKREITDKPKIQQPRSFLRLLNSLQQKAGTLRRGGLSEVHKFKDEDCKTSNCTQWKCTVRNFRAGFRLKLTVMARLFNNTMIKHGFYGAEISSVIIAQVSKLTYKAPGGLDLPVKYAIATTTVTPIESHKLKRGLPWWLILLAILTGLALLILLTLLLWRCGFFKRKRPPRGQALLAKPSEAEYYGYSTYSAGNPNYPAHTAVPYGQRL